MKDPQTQMKTDKLLGANVVCVMMLTSSVSDVHLSLVYEPLVRISANCCVVLTHVI